MIKFEKIKTSYILIAIGLMIISVIVYCAPRDYDHEIESVRFQLGEKNSDNYEKIKVSFHGDYTRRLFSGDKFRGNIKIGEDKIEFVELNFHKSNKYVIFGLLENEKEYNNYGVIYTDGNLNEFAIIILQGEEDYGSWSREDGIMVSGEAFDREEAIDIANKIMEPYLVDVKLK